MENVWQSEDADEEDMVWYEKQIIKFNLHMDW